MTIQEFTKQGYTIDEDYSKVVYYTDTFSNKQLVQAAKNHKLDGININGEEYDSDGATDFRYSIYNQDGDAVELNNIMFKGEKWPIFSCTDLSNDELWQIIDLM